jgi:hypothetical protein
MGDIAIVQDRPDRRLGALPDSPRRAVSQTTPLDATTGVRPGLRLVVEGGVSWPRAARLMLVLRSSTMHLRCRIATRKEESVERRVGFAPKVS